MVLHNNEMNLMFQDKATKQLINFDLEKGAIVDEVDWNSNLVQDGHIKICNDRKNSQVDTSALF
jgi:hypothetical protein